MLHLKMGLKVIPSRLCVLTNTSTKMRIAHTQNSWMAAQRRKCAEKGGEKNWYFRAPINASKRRETSRLKSCNYHKWIGWHEGLMAAIRFWCAGLFSLFAVIPNSLASHYLVLELLITKIRSIFHPDSRVSLLFGLHQKHCDCEKRKQFCGCE